MNPREVLNVLLWDWQRSYGGGACSGGPASIMTSEVEAWLCSRLTHWESIVEDYEDRSEG